MWTCDCPGKLRMRSNEKGVSETVRFLAAKTNGNEKGASETMKFLAAEQTMWRDSVV